MKRDSGRSEGADVAESLRLESEKIIGKIDAAFDKLANKLRDRADKAGAKAEGAKNDAKRAVRLRRSQLYADAAAYLDERKAHRREETDAGSD